MARYNCPSCGSGETQRRSLIASAGTTNNVNFAAGSFGTTHGRRGFDAVNFGTSSTKLAQESSAPGKRLVFLLALPGFFLAGLVALKFDAVGFYTVLGIFSYWAYVNFLWNKNEWPIRYENWANSFLCHRCGEVFVSGKYQSISPSVLNKSEEKKNKAIKIIATLVAIFVIYNYANGAIGKFFQRINDNSEFDISGKSAVPPSEPPVVDSGVPSGGSEPERISSDVSQVEQTAASNPRYSADSSQDVEPERRSRIDNLGSSGERSMQAVPRGYLQLRFEPGPRGSGVYIQDVIPGGVAERAGLRSGDMISYINGEHVAGGDGLISVLSKYRPGDIIEIEAMPADWSGARTYKLRLDASPTP